MSTLDLSATRSLTIGLHAVLGLATVGCFLASLAIGPADLSLGKALAALFGHGPAADQLIVREIRLPRALLALTIGATLGLSGAGLQGLLRNPLAEPGLLGASSMAAFGGVVAMYFGVYAAFPLALPLFAMLGALAAVLLILVLAGRDAGTLTIILAGVAISSFGAALISLAINLSNNPYAVTEIVFWLMGSLANRSMEHVWLALPFMAAGWLLIAGTGRALDALTLGDDAAGSLGFNLGRIRLQTILGTALSVGAAVAVAGSIGFVGLIVPHLLRPFVGHQPSRLLPASALGGAILLLVADIAVRTLPTTAELRLGVLTAVIGVPFFLFLILKTRRDMA
ncbi:MAG: iron ABC transporter permease [Alphaproteobacteria bacterium]|nr:iron ABC transporter permease [Alphaproteobacteria bacterium]